MMLSGTSRQNYDNIKTLWSSLLPINILSESHSDDEEIVKLSLLLKATQLLVTGLRQKQLSTAGQLQSATDALRSAMVKVEQLESETKALRKDLSMVKFELQSAEGKAKKFQIEADTSKANCERLQSKISSEVEARLHNMFKNCLQQNKAATVLEMMTQLGQDTQAREVAECPVKRIQASEHPSEMQSKRTKVLVRNTILDEASPDTSLILGTPEPHKSASQRSKNLKSRKNEIVLPKSVLTIPHSAPSSPDEIACTPPSIVEKKKNQRKEKIRKFLNSDVKESDIVDVVQQIVYAKDTQDLDQVPITSLRSALKENVNIEIPPTLNPDVLEEEKDEICSPKRNKENGMSSPGCNNQQRRSALSTSMQYPSTPEKALKSREASPILGNSSSKKSCLRLPNSTSANVSSNFSSKKNRLKVSSALSAAEVSYRRTSSGKCRKSVQQSITSFTSHASKSNRSSSKLTLRRESFLGGASKFLEFNNEQPVETDVSRNVSYLTEKEQLEMAISNSMKENYLESRLEDSDTTLFVPNNPCLKNNQSVQGNMKPPLVPNPVEKKGQSQKVTSEVFFEPMFASTAREEVNLTEQTCPTEPSKIMTRASQFKPPLASTEKELTENSALHDLKKLMDEQALHNTAPYPPDTSYDRLPKMNTSPNYKYKGEPVRKKNERKNLPGLECTQCGQYFAAAFDADDQDARRILVNSCSRHRDRNGPRPSTPKQYWDPGWTSPAEAVIVKKHQEN